MPKRIKKSSYSALLAGVPRSAGSSLTAFAKCEPLWLPPGLIACLSTDASHRSALNEVPWRRLATTARFVSESSHCA